MSGDRLFDELPSYRGAKFPPPRPFQDTAHQALRQGVKDGHRRQVLMAPTGGGKTYLGLRIAHEALVRGKKAVFVCDRTTLINQTSNTADSYDLAAHGIIQAQHWRRNNEMPFQIASAQTLARSNGHLWPDADVIIIDEAHTLHKTWVDHIQTARGVVVALSATPFSPGMGKIFSNLVNATTMHELTQSGVLVPMRVFSCTSTNMEGAETANGEWTQEAAEQRGMAIIGDVVSEWIKLSSERKTIVFGATIRHCEELCQQFINAGVMAAVFTSDTDAVQRDLLLKEYRKSDSSLRVLISVEALAKGFDVPDVGCVVDCRPLRKALSTAIQMWGRGLRSSPDTGKVDCHLLDHSGNILRFLEDYTDIFFNGLDALDMGEKLDKKIRDDKDKKDPKGCPVCQYKPFAKRCMSCGFEIKTEALVEHVPGEMREVMLGKKKLADDRYNLWEQVCTYAKVHGQNKTDGQRYGRAFNLYKQMAGTEPPRTWRLDSTRNVEITLNVLNKIRSLNMAYAKAREKATA